MSSRSLLFAVVSAVALLANPKVGLSMNVTDGLLYEWSLNETSGTTAVDSISDRNMQAQGSVVAGVSGRTGTAYSFDGVDDYLAAPDSAETFGSGDFTLSAWVRTTASQSKVAPLLSHKSSAGWFELALNYNGTPYFFTRDYGTFGYIGLSGGPALTNGLWHLVSLVRQGHSAYLYADSTLVASGSDDLLATVTGLGGLLIGGSSQGYYKGAIDDVAIYNRALSPGEIAVNVVPEPTSLLLTVTGMCSMAALTRGRARHRSQGKLG